MTSEEKKHIMLEARNINNSIPTAHIALIGKMKTLRADCRCRHHHKSGWGRPPEFLSYVQDSVGEVKTVGLTGCCYKVLDISTDYGECVDITGVRTDGPKKFSIFVSNDGKSWKQVSSKLQSTAAWPSTPISARYSRLIWEQTKGSRGFHCQLYGLPTKAQLNRRQISRCLKGPLAASPASKSIPTTCVPLIGTMRSLRTSCGHKRGPLTGWRKPVELLSYQVKGESEGGSDGVVGCCFGVLDVESEYGEKVEIVGVRTDSPNEFAILVSNDRKTWTTIASNVKHTISWSPTAVPARYSRLVWEETPGTNGFHCQLYGLDTPKQKRLRRPNNISEGPLIHAEFKPTLPPNAVALIGSMRSLRAQCNCNHTHSTGWGKPIALISYVSEGGPVFSEGILGCCYRVLDVFTDYGEEVSILGVRTDSTKRFSLFVSQDNKHWTTLATNLRGTISWDSPVTAVYSRLVWQETRGKPFHCQLYGLDTPTQKKLRSPDIYSDVFDAAEKLIRGKMSRRGQVTERKQNLNPNESRPPPLVRMTSEEKMERWTEDREIKSLCPDFQPAASKICLRREWITHAKIAKILEFFGEDFESCGQLRDSLKKLGVFTVIGRKLVAKGYSIREDQVRRQRCLMTGHLLMEQLCSIFGFLKWRKAYLALALLYWLHLADPDSIIVKLGEISDRAARCASARRLAFDVAIKFAHSLVTKKRSQTTEKKADELELVNLESVKSKCRKIFEEYIDLHKHHAYKSAIEEPCRAYFNAHHNHCHRDHFDVHGFNWYLAGTSAAIGMKLPLVPYLHDSCNMGFSAYWHAKGGDEMWKEFKKAENFGKRFEAIYKVKTMSGGRMGRNEECRLEGNMGLPLQFGQTLTRDSTSRTRKWAVYMDRLCYFFTREFFCQKAISILIQENSEDPTRMGFRKVLEGLFYHYKNLSAEDVEAENVLEFIYDDEKCVYDTDRINNLLFIGGITKEQVELPKRRGIKNKPEQKDETTPKLPKIDFKGSQKLLDLVTKKVASGAPQSEIFRSCRASGLGNSKEIFTAIKFAIIKKMQSRV